MNKELTRKILTYIAIVVFFLVLSYAFVPQVLGGKIVNQADISHWTGMTHEIVEHNAAHPDDPTYWTNSMFGGMPSVTMYDKFEGDWTNPVYKFLLLGKRPATYFFIALLGAFLLMLSLGIDKFLAVGGAIAVAFCSYNMQIIQVGHNTKMQAIAFFPWVLAALVFTYRSSVRDGKWLSRTVLGSVLFAMALSFQIKANHPQITWYLAAVIFIYALVLFINVLLDKTGRKEGLKRFFTASLLLLAIGSVGIATNANKLIPTWKYTRHTMRGGSELTASDGGKGGDGLDLAYATAWSYGVGETPNLLIPNFNGGASAGKLSQNSETAKVLKKYGYKGRELQSTLESLPTYWGPQPFTAGPMYLGAISVFLFVLGMFLYRGKEKWWLFAASLFALMLGWGSHMMWFTRLCFDTLPMYNKFRTVSMAIIVLQATVPMLGFIVLDRIVRCEYTKTEFRKAGLRALAITGGFCLVCLLIPGIAGTFSAEVDSQLPDEIARSLVSDRRALLRHDALRSLLLVGAAFLLILWAFNAAPEGKETPKKNGFALAGRMWIAAAAICVLVLVDMFGVGKRYLNDSHFVTRKAFSGQFEAREVDKYILEDEDPDYRVLDLSVNTFNDAFQSYWHKCIGGYSPAKMQRYQDLIDRYITREMNSIIKVANAEGTIQGIEAAFPDTPVLNMLNTKYVILQDNLPPVENIHRNGNCWLVENVQTFGTPDEEIALLGSTDLRKTALMSCDDADKLPASFTVSKFDDIRLTSYAANELHYAYSVENDALAVFSEVFYPGWKVYMDGVEAQPLRVDWILRALPLQAGDGEIVMRFEPESYKVGENISRASSITLLLLLLLSCGKMLLGRTSVESEIKNQ